VRSSLSHAGWWDHIALFFSHTHRVIAPDLSGHGDSGTRMTDPHTWAREILAGATVAGPSGRPTIVGHKLGGLITSTPAHHYGEQIDSIVVIDTPLLDHAPEEARLRNRKLDTTGYRSKDKILARFRTVPSQEAVLPYVEHHIAVEAVRKSLKGWFWRQGTALGSALRPHTAVTDRALPQTGRIARVQVLVIHQGLPKRARHCLRPPVRHAGRHQRTDPPAHR
jgi:pimeloyl-ACP methyl ester carboxylesterase